MQEVVGVKFKQASKVYYFNPRGEKYELGDEVVVDTQSGNAIGVVAKTNFLVSDIEIEQPLRDVIRKVNGDDSKKMEKLKRRAKESLPIIVDKINSLKLPMKVVDVQYAFDESKVTISYTSEDRVDFRELLKLLASALKTKIELRQIGVRDEVKAVGALGLCGMPCCCTTFLKEGERVVVKMAKTQNMSLSPSKTGGACGKMMCCLAFEEPVYRELLSKMPKVGSTINTPDGRGVVQYNNIIKESVTVKIVAEDESYKFVEYKAVDLGINLYDNTSINDDTDLKNENGKDTKQTSNSVDKSRFEERKNFSADQRDSIIKGFNESIKKAENNENNSTDTNLVDFEQKNDYNKKDEVNKGGNSGQDAFKKHKKGFHYNKFRHNSKYKKEN